MYASLDIVAITKNCHRLINDCLFHFCSPHCSSHCSPNLNRLHLFSYLKWAYRESRNSASRSILHKFGIYSNPDAVVSSQTNRSHVSYPLDDRPNNSNCFNTFKKITERNIRKKNLTKIIMKKRGFLHFYLILVLAYGILGLVDNFMITFDVTTNIVSVVLKIIFLIFFLFNILVIFTFYYLKEEKIAYILPIYYILSYGLFFGVGFLLTLLNLIMGWIWIILINISVFASLFEIIFSVYLLRRFDFI